MNDGMDDDDYVIEAPPVPEATYKPRAGARATAAPFASLHTDGGADGGSVPAGGKKGGKKAPNPRAGKAKRGKDGEAAQIVPGDAAAPGAGSFDPQEICELVDLWWELDGGDTFVLRTGDKETGKWARWPMGAVKQYIRKILKEQGRYIAQITRKGSDEVLSELDEVLIWARIHRSVDEVIPALAGFRAGTIKLSDGREVVVRRSPNLIEGVKGEWPTIKALIEGLLDIQGEPKQSDYFHAWCQVSYKSLRFGKPGSYKPGHALVIAGPGGSGKSRLQVNIVTPLLGGRSGDPTAFLTGDDSFNSDLIGSEHLMMEELLTNSWSAADRVNLSEAMKRMVANENKRLRLMRTDPITVQPFWRLTISMNNDPDKMRAFPMLTPDFRDKVVMLLAYKRPLPMPTQTDVQQEAFNTKIRSEMPAYIDWLVNEFQIPAPLLVDERGEDATRFGFNAQQHHSLSDALFEDTPAAQLLRLIDQAVIEKPMAGNIGIDYRLWELPHPYNLSGGKKRGGEWVNQPGVWEGSAEMLEDLLCGHKEGWKSSVMRSASRLMSKGSLPAMLARLREDQPDRVDKHDRAKLRGWMICAPVGGEPLPAAPAESEAYDPDKDDDAAADAAAAAEAGNGASDLAPAQGAD